MCQKGETEIMTAPVVPTLPLSAAAECSAGCTLPAPEVWGTAWAQFRDLVATGIWHPEKLFQMPNHRNINLYPLCKLICITQYTTVRRHFLLLTLYSAHLFFICFLLSLQTQREHIIQLLFRVECCPCHCTDGGNKGAFSHNEPLEC